ncbi:TIGR01459 family HAD-type hydrolase [Microvirga lotononidis]|uniref:HAD-superfamily class IIA hydrolase, TIGR01459 n=1 Tax=Microvirga lotononidis TaxID=864069 RepID=I4YPI8_9HYPH|nr:TIGR01459 family HAD-type hydrolase [Microvirga lotononidis]EIM25880.1 HAD-superfamily class IIA hydrolase, TIGR01459 [Microvirga lotononidis]WQO25799.1 TIGR01459 family HAD-type hydrolase [Microvirga lotononidis]
MTALSRPAHVEGLHTLADRYDLVLCDVWGVLHNGVKAYEAASDALTRFRARGGRVVLVSNAPRPGASVGTQLDGFGVPRTAYDSIVTSGDLTRLAIEERIDRIVHHIGPPRDMPIYDGLDVRFGSVEEADYVVCSGFDNDEEETVEDYRPQLEAMLRRDLLMVCANPDLIVERGNMILPCAGTIALAYEEMGGNVFYAGKPHGPVYDQALSVAAEVSGRAMAKDRVLAVGDAIRTDIAGAVGYGIDSLMIARGIHAEELGLHKGDLVSDHVQDWVDRQPVRPTAFAEVLSW